MNRFLNVIIVFYSVEKRFYSVENLVQKPVGEQDKTHEFSLSNKVTTLFILCWPNTAPNTMLWFSQQNYGPKIVLGTSWANRFLNKVLNGIKTFFNRKKNNNNVEKPVREQDKP